MSSFGGVPLDMYELGIDFMISSANKCIQGVPGFGFIIACKIRTVTLQRRFPFTSLIFTTTGDDGKGHGKWRFTSPTHVVRAFKQALAELEEEGGVAARHKRYCEKPPHIGRRNARTRLQTLLPDEFQSPIITSFLYPKAGFDFNSFYTQLKEKGFVIYPGKISPGRYFPHRQHRRCTS